MQFTALALAILPALALADAGSAQDAATTKLIKTLILSQVPHTSSTQCHNTTSTTSASTTTTTTTTTFYNAHNTTSYMPTGSVASHTMPLGTASAFTTTTTTTTTGAAGPSDTATTPPPASSSKGPLNAAGVLDASNVAFAGVVGMLAVALM